MVEGSPASSINVIVSIRRNALRLLRPTRPELIRILRALQWETIVKELFVHRQAIETGRSASLAPVVAFSNARPSRESPVFFKRFHLQQI